MFYNRFNAPAESSIGLGLKGDVAIHDETLPAEHQAKAGNLT